MVINCFFKDLWKEHNIFLSDQMLHWEVVYKVAVGEIDLVFAITQLCMISEVRCECAYHDIQCISAST